MQQLFTYMYSHNIEKAIFLAGWNEGYALGNLYVFASKFEMEGLRYNILEALADRHRSAPILLDAARVIYNELRRDELFRLFFGEHIVEWLCEFQPGQQSSRAYQKVEIAKVAAEGGLFGSDLIEALLAALLNKRLLLLATPQPRSIPPSYNSGWLGSGPLDSPMVREEAAIAIRDWDGGNFSKLSFYEGDRITIFSRVVDTRGQRGTTPGSGLVRTGTITTSFPLSMCVLSTQS